MTKKILTQAKLKEILHYNPETGIFTWIVGRTGKAFAGSVAGSYKTGSYRQIKINSKLYAAHRLAWLYMVGKWPKNEIDHINHAKDDNRFDNLREATRRDNLMNVGMLKNNTSGVMGVHWHKIIKRWTANIGINGSLKHLYCGCDFFEAVCARKSAENKYGFHENHGH